MKVRFDGNCAASIVTEEGYEANALGHSWLRWEGGDDQVVYFRLEKDGLMIENAERATELELALGEYVRSELEVTNSDGKMH